MMADKSKSSVGIARDIEAKITSGQIAPGNQLQSAREAAAELRVDRNTVAAAYRILKQRGLVETRVPGGTFVVDRRRSRNSLDWTRWWRRLHPDPELAPVEFKGFIHNPDNDFSVNAHLKPLRDLSDKRVLILLGEAGAGKTFESRCLLDDDGVDDKLMRTIRIDLGHCDNQERLEHAIHEDPTVQEWKASDSLQLRLILDSFDEADGVVKALPDTLIRVLEKLPCERMLIRVFCRGSAWPDTLGNQFQTLWPDEDVEIWELTSLTREDIVHAVTTRGFDGEEFVNQVCVLGLEELAKRPITLFMLIDAFERDQLKDVSVSGLYEKGLFALLESPEQPRYERHTAKPLDRQLMMRHAGAVAAMSVLCAKPILARTSSVNDDDGVLSLDALLSTMPIAADKRPERADIERLFDSALFAPAGPQRVQFAHKSYAEFLVARFLIDSAMTNDQILPLLTVGQGAVRRIAPQLHAVAAWLAGMRQELFKNLVELDPDALLRGDLESLNNVQRATLVDELMDAVGAERISRARLWSVRHAFKRLHHPGIVAQLRATIANSKLPELVRDIAIDIAEATCLEELGDDLASVMLDPKQPHRLRISAGYALRQVRSEQVRRRLVPLAMERLEDDREMTLRGYALHCVWPGFITAQELFQALEPESAPNLYASYASFLESIPQKLADADVRPALSWANRVIESGETRGTLERVCLAVVRRAWEQLDTEPELAEFMAPIIERRLELHEAFLILPEGVSWRSRVDEQVELQKEIAQHSTRRRALVKVLVARAKGEQNQHDALRLLYGYLPLVLREDLSWLIERVFAQDSSDKSHWIELANRLVLHCAADSWTDAEVSQILNAREAASTTALFDFIDPVEINSDRAKELRKHHAKLKALGRPRRQGKAKRRKEELTREQAEYLLAFSQRAPYWSWSWLSHLLFFGKSWDEFESAGSASPQRLSNTPLWLSADKRMKDAIVKAAERVLEACCPLVWHDISDTSYDPVASQLWQALQLVYDEDRHWVEQRPGEWWSIWAPFVVAGAADRFDPDDLRNRELGQLALTHAKTQVIEAITNLMRAATRRDVELPTLTRFDATSNRDLHRVVCDVLSHAPWLGPKAFKDAFSFLLKVAPGMARQVAADWFSNDAITSENRRDQSIVAAQLAVYHLDDAAWPMLWPVMQRHGSWALDVLEGFVDCSWRDERPFWIKLRPEEWGELVYWMNTDLPLGVLPDRTGTGAYSPTKEEEVDRLRQAGTNGLIKQYPTVAKDVMQRLRRAKPEKHWFAELLVEAADGANAGQWQPLEPLALKRLVKDRQARFVETEEQLLELVIESVQRFEVGLHDKFTPLVENLWNTSSADRALRKKSRTKGVRAPSVNRSFKGEEHLADNLAVHLRRELQERGVVVNREVQINRPSKGERPKGKRLDILIEAIDPYAEDQKPLRVIVETKVDSNDEWRTGLSEQLADRYLNKHECRTGLYMVGWSGDIRQKATLERRLEQQTEAIKTNAPLLTVRAMVIDCRLS